MKICVIEFIDFYYMQLLTLTLKMQNMKLNCPLFVRNRKKHIIKQQYIVV